MTRAITDIAASLAESAVLMELAGENQFKVRAHANAARVVENWGGSVGDLLAAVAQGQVRGIGAGLAKKVQDFSVSDTEPEIEGLKKKLPPGLMDMLRVPGLGPKKVKALWEKLGITTLAALEEASRKNLIANLKGFGAKTQSNILAGIERLKSYADQFLFPTANSSALPALEFIRSHKACLRAEIAGSLRRKKETVRDLDFVASSKTPAKVIEHFLTYPEISSVTSHGETKAAVVLKNGMSVDVRVVHPTEFPAALNYFTGSKAHNVRLRSLAADHGYKLNEYGLFRHEAVEALQSEADIYSALNLSYIEPEMREDTGEIEKAARAFTAQQNLPALVEAKNLRGIMHAHTTYSDGRHSLREMALAVRAAGYEYFVVTDHSRTAAYAGGLSIEAVHKQHREIERLNEELAPFRIFKGIESDILADGSLDYPPEVLKQFEVVIASVHAQFSMSQPEMTARIVAAARNPFTTVIGHLTGRLLLEREAYAVDVPQVIEVCAQEGVAIELNANPYRLDLDWRFHQQAIKWGVQIPINPDAHSIEGIADVDYGVGIARKGGLTVANVPTCLTLDKFDKWRSRRIRN